MTLVAISIGVGLLTVLWLLTRDAGPSANMVDLADIVSKAASTASTPRRPIDLTGIFALATGAAALTGSMFAVVNTAETTPTERPHDDASVHDLFQQSCRDAGTAAASVEIRNRLVRANWNQKGEALRRAADMPVADVNSHLEFGELNVMLYLSDFGSHLVTTLTGRAHPGDAGSFYIDEMTMRNRTSPDRRLQYEYQLGSPDGFAWRPADFSYNVPRPELSTDPATEDVFEARVVLPSEALDASGAFRLRRVLEIAANDGAEPHTLYAVSSDEYRGLETMNFCVGPARSLIDVAYAELRPGAGALEMHPERETRAESVEARLACGIDAFGLSSLQSLRELSGTIEASGTGGTVRQLAVSDPQGLGVFIFGANL